MDCKTAKEKINMFDFLPQEEKDEVLAHAQSCKACRDELINSAKLREALAELGELEPPAGLAQSAIKKAKKTLKIPPFAYISVAVAAVVAVAFFATSGVLSPRMNSADESAKMLSPADEQILKANSDTMDAGVAAESSVVEEQAMAADSYMEDSAAGSASVRDEELQYEIYVSADKADFAAAVEEFLGAKEIYIDSYMQDADTQVIMFVVGELNLEEFKALLTEYEMDGGSDISAGTLINMMIEK